MLESIKVHKLVLSLLQNTKVLQTTITFLNIEKLTMLRIDGRGRI